MGKVVLLACYYWRKLEGRKQGRSFSSHMYTPKSSTVTCCKDCWCGQPGFWPLPPPWAPEGDSFLTNRQAAVASPGELQASSVMKGDFCHGLSGGADSFAIWDGGVRPVDAENYMKHLWESRAAASTEFPLTCCVYVPCLSFCLFGSNQINFLGVFRV